MSHSTTCLNCEEPVSKKFCPNCGQKTNTHRITFKHFVTHDILHGVWHIDRGILFTLKEALLRPGKAALDYISGKRVRYYNVFYLTLLIIGLNLFINHFFDILNKKYSIESYSSNSKMDSILTDYAKLFILSIIPLLAINSYVIYKKRKLNLSEHFIIGGMFVLGILIITTFGNLFYFFDYTENLVFLSKLFNVLTPITILFYLIIGYFKTFNGFYTNKQSFIRSILLLFLFILEMVILGLLLKNILK
jgi:hypothetical protein